jgi:hypothetical protein
MVKRLLHRPQTELRQRRPFVRGDRLAFISTIQNQKLYEFFNLENIVQAILEKQELLVDECWRSDHWVYSCNFDWVVR